MTIGHCNLTNQVNQTSQWKDTREERHTQFSNLLNDKLSYYLTYIFYNRKSTPACTKLHIKWCHKIRNHKSYIILGADFSFTYAVCFSQCRAVTAGNFFIGIWTSNWNHSKTFIFILPYTSPYQACWDGLVIPVYKIYTYIYCIVKYFILTKIVCYIHCALQTYITFREYDLICRLYKLEISHCNYHLTKLRRTSY